MRKNHIKILLLIIIIYQVFILSGCTNNNYATFEKQYYKSYFEITGVIDISHTKDSLEKLQSKDIETKIIYLGNLIDSIKDNVPKGSEKQYSKFVECYEGIKYLREAYKRWDQLDKDERRRIDIETLNIATMRDLYEKYNRLY